MKVRRLVGHFCEFGIAQTRLEHDAGAYQGACTAEGPARGSWAVACTSRGDGPGSLAITKDAAVHSFLARGAAGPDIERAGIVPAAMDHP